MRKNENNFAYIDGANLHTSVRNLGWELDYGRFRVWLSEKYGIKKAYLFIGLIPKNKDLYTKLQEQGYTLVFKEVTYDHDGKAKGNCDADLVLKCMDDTCAKSFDKAVVVTSDGDYASLIKLLNNRGKFHVLLSPARERRCSVLLKRISVPIAYINDQRSILKVTRSLKEKAPDADGTA